MATCRSECLKPKIEGVPARRFFSCLACSSLLSVWKARGGPLGKNGGNFSDSSCCWMRWNSLRLAGTAEDGKKLLLYLTPREEESGTQLYDINSLISPLHCQAILLWQVAPGLLKSQAAQVASSTIADGCKRKKCLIPRLSTFNPAHFSFALSFTCRRLVRMILGYIAPTSRW